MVSARDNLRHVHDMQLTNTFQLMSPRNNLAHRCAGLNYVSCYRAEVGYELYTVIVKVSVFQC